MITRGGRRVPLVPILIALALAAYGAQRYLADRAAVNSPIIEGSGTIEATQVQIASKMPGRVSAVLVESGDAVRAGAVLVRFETAETDAQVAQAASAVDVARARVSQAEAALRAQRAQATSTIEQARAASSAAGVRVPQADVAVKLQQEQWEQQRSQARAAVASAEAALAAAVANRAAVRANLRRAEQDLVRANALLREGAVAAQAVDAAKAAVDVLTAQEAAAAAQEAAAGRQVEQARAALALVDASRQQVTLRQQDVSVAKAQRAQAEAAAEGAKSARDLVAQRAQDVAAARAALAQAEAALRYARAFAANTMLTSPIAGVVLSRSIEPGEVVGAGVSLLTVADLRTVWLRIFIPEDRLGRLKIGQRAEVSVDAFPRRTFTARITEIASQAEFTPRNVQTKQERAKLVFGVRLTLENQEGLLKPGMPADATIDTNGP